MSPADPFSSRFEVFGREHRHSVASVNQRAFEHLGEFLDTGRGGDGRVILLRAPRAGYGKTSLLQRLAGEFAESHQFVRVNLTSGRTTDAAHVLEYVLQALCEVLPHSTTLTKLDLLARGVLALGLEPLVASGEVPCQDPDGALAALRENPAETFDFHHDRAVTAHWTKSNFEILGPRLAAELARESGASLREASYWVELLFRFATTPPDNVERARLLFETIFRGDLQGQSSSATEERLHGLLALCATVTSPVLIVDDTEGLSTSPSDALALASFLSNISQSCPGTVVILSVNDDIWDSAFLPLLPGGLADRLLEHSVSLDALTREEAEALVSARAGERSSEVIAAMDWSADGKSLYSRKVLKLASEAWLQLEHEDPELTALSSGLASGSTTPLPGAREEVDIEDALSDLPDFEEIRPARKLEEKETQWPPAREQAAPSWEGQTQRVLGGEPSIADRVESPFAPDPSPEPEETPEEELSLPQPTQPGPEREPEKRMDQSPSFVPVGGIEPEPGKSSDGEESPPRDPEESPAPDESPRETFPVAAPGVHAPDTFAKDISPSSDPVTCNPEKTGHPPVSQPISPFVAVFPPGGVPDVQTPSSGTDSRSDSATAPVEEGEPEEFPAETVYPFSDGEEARPGVTGNDTPSTVASADLDPTGGEIEFAKLKPLSEEPPSGPASPGFSTAAEPAESPDPGVAQPQAAATRDSPFTPVSPASPASSSPEDVFVPVSPVSDAGPSSDPSLETPFTPVTPQATTPSSSPFAAVDPQSPAESSGDTAPTPAQPSPFEPGSSPSAPSSWWPGDAPASTGGPDGSSPFAAVGSPPPGSTPQGSPQPSASPDAGDAAPTDKEEVDKLLRQLREGQD
ncbi:MAG: hypothetical protein MK194_14745 [Roseibacillus sp.]|nr:hypothetical protein [Roseibacillus sp.]